MLSVSRDPGCKRSEPKKMRIVVFSAILSLAYCQLGQQTTGPPWYWKPNKEPLAVYTTPDPTDIEIDRFKRQILNPVPFRDPMPEWYAEVLKRKNQTNGEFTASPPPPPSPPMVMTHGCPKDVTHDRYHGRGYFFSWEDDRSANLRMSWNQALYFCRARCMELVSIETPQEHDFIAKHIINGRLRSVWTSGRKCDFAGCEKEKEMQPADIYGWFWEGSRTQLPPTTDRFDSLWSHTGPLGKPQPDNHDGQKGGEKESCLAVLNNAYGDGIAWHDSACSKRKPFICEQSTRNRPEWQKTEIVGQPDHIFQYHLITV